MHKAFFDYLFTLRIKYTERSYLLYLEIGYGLKGSRRVVITIKTIFFVLFHFIHNFRNLFYYFYNFRIYIKNIEMQYQIKDILASLESLNKIKFNFQFFFKFIYFERGRVQVGGSEREEESQAGTMLSAQSPCRLELTKSEILTWPNQESDT